MNKWSSLWGVLCFSVDMKFNYTKRVYFVTMGTFHMAILLLYNNATTLPFREIEQHTQLPEKELIKQLQALVDAKILEVQVRQNT